MARKGQRRPDIEAPTQEQQAGGVFAIEDVLDRTPGGAAISIVKAYRRTPMIKILLASHVISYEDWKALNHYRHHADLADRSPIRDSLCLQRGGRGNGPTISTLHAIRVRDDCERAAGSLADILRMIVVYDWSLSQWAMHRHGSVEKRRPRGNRIEPTAKAMEIARLEIRIAASRVRGELDAPVLDKAA